MIYLPASNRPNTRNTNPQSQCFDFFTRSYFLFVKLVRISPRHSFSCCFTEPWGIAPQREQHSSVALIPLTPEQIEFPALRFVQVLDAIEDPFQGFPCTRHASHVPRSLSRCVELQSICISQCWQDTIFVFQADQGPYIAHLQCYNLHRRGSVALGIRT